MIPFQVPVNVNVKAEHHFAFASIRLRSDGIVQINTEENKLMTISETIQIHNKVNELNHNKPVYILHVPGMHTSADDETRKYLASDEGMKNRAAFAFVIRSFAQRLVANFFLKINKPKIPVAFFDTQEKAEKWLYNLKEEVIWK
jgi:hypothetical protein